MTARPLILSALLAAATALPVRAEPDLRAITVDPAAVRLTGPNAICTLLVTGQDADGRPLDLTGEARFRSVQPRVATVTAGGVVRAVADGSTEITVEAAGRSLRVPVVVEGTTRPRRFNFANDVVSLFSRHGCNASGCHGKAEGQNGFKLSVFGSDPAADYAALLKEGRGRRIFATSPEHSLLLRKASGGAAHGGGVRIPRGSADYETLRAWVGNSSASSPAGPTAARPTSPITPASSRTTTAWHRCPRTGWSAPARPRATWR